MKKLSPFTLIELLIVIAIIGILATLTIPHFSNVEADAKDAITNYNAASIGNFINSFNAANGKYPSNLHLGTTQADFGSTAQATNNNTLSNLPSAVLANITAGNATWAPLRKTCMANSGMVSFACGATGLDSVWTTDGRWGYSNPVSPADELLAIKVVNDWTTTGASNGTVIRFNGMTMKDLLDKAPWVRADNAQAIAHSEQVVIYAFFFGPTTNTQGVFKSDGSFWKNSRASLNVKLPSGVTTFNYPLVFFRLSKTEATFLGAVTFSEDGATIIQQ